MKIRASIHYWKKHSNIFIKIYFNKVIYLLKSHWCEGQNSGFLFIDKRNIYSMCKGKIWRHDQVAHTEWMFFWSDPLFCHCSAKGSHEELSSYVFPDSVLLRHSFTFQKMNFVTQANGPLKPSLLKYIDC